MDVIIKKVHKKYESLFPIGSHTTLTKSNPAYKYSVVSPVDKLVYDADDLLRCFSNKASFSDIFTRVNPKQILQ